MLEYINEDGVKQGINPFDHGSAYTDIMKTQALKQALNKYGFTAAFGGGRRDEENQEQRKEFSHSEMKTMHGIRRTNVLKCGSYITQNPQGREHKSFPYFKLDRGRYMAVYKERKDRDCTSLFCRCKTCCIP